MRPAQPAQLVQPALQAAQREQRVLLEPREQLVRPAQLVLMVLPAQPGLLEQQVQPEQQAQRDLSAQPARPEQMA